MQYGIYRAILSCAADLCRMPKGRGQGNRHANWIDLGVVMTQPRTIPIPEQLQDWRPACGMAEAWPGSMPACDSEATLAVIHHNRCGITLSCVNCYKQYLLLLSDWARHTCNHCCKVCGQDVNDPLSAIQLEPL